jgi:predicted phosphodiesterase
MKFEHRMKVYKAAGYEVGELYVVGMGDLVEKCSNNYPDQEFTTDMTEREQKRVARHLLKWIVKRASKLAARVVVCTVGGNHGENRNAGKAFTDTSDNDDVALFESVAEALAENTEAFGHVTFNIPHDELMVVMEIAGTNICFTHGHLAKGGATPEKKQTNWWKNQQFGNLTAGDADVLVTAHYHHFQAVELADGKMWLQCPSQDGGSKWFQDQTGANSRPGSLCFVVGPDGPTLLDVV